MQVSLLLNASLKRYQELSDNYYSLEPQPKRRHISEPTNSVRDETQTVSEWNTLPCFPTEDPFVIGGEIPNQAVFEDNDEVFPISTMDPTSYWSQELATPSSFRFQGDTMTQELIAQYLPAVDGDNDIYSSPHLQYMDVQELATVHAYSDHMLLEDEDSAYSPPTESGLGKSQRESNKPAKTAYGMGTANAQVEQYAPRTCFGEIAVLGRKTSGLASAVTGRVKIQHLGSLLTVRSEDDEVIGVIDHTFSKKLQQLFSRFNVKVEGYVPRALDDGAEDMNIALTIFGDEKINKEVGEMLSDLELYLQDPMSEQTMNGRRYSNPHMLVVPKDIMMEIQSELENEDPTGELESYCKRENGVIDLFEGEWFLRELTYTPTVSPRIMTKLLPHQNEALVFMTLQERKIQIDASLPSLWERYNEIGDELKYRHIITRETCKGIPKQASGGIIADEMGMGKTLTTLAFIATSLDTESDEEMSDLTEENSCDSPPAVRASLLVVPLATVSNWESQISRHTKGLRVLYYKGKADASKPPSDYDIVIATYKMVASCGKAKSLDNRKYFRSVRWRRVVLDEAHYIRNRKTQQTREICALEAESRWCLTGTPVQNQLDDFGALLQFLRLAPLHEKAKFSKHIITPLKKNGGSEYALSNLHKLISSTTLRRSKNKLSLEGEDVHLASRVDTVQRISFSEKEQALHSHILSAAKEALDKAVKSGGERLSTSIIMQHLLRLRQLCNGLELLPKDYLQAQLKMMESPADAGFIPTNADMISCHSCEATVKADTGFQFWGCYHFLCPRCAPKNPQESESGMCPRCSGGSYDDDNNVKSCNTTPQPELQQLASCYRSSKIKGLLKNLSTNADSKSVVFACWTNTLDLIAQELTREKIEFARIDGSMSSNKRTENLARFREHANLTVLLASIGSCGVGIDLTAASCIHLMEPQYNPMAEEQALARVHRIGQTQEVTTIRYIMKYSYEESIIEMQNKKLRLADLCSQTKSGASLSLQQLRSVLK